MAAAKKSSCIPLGDADGTGPSLWLDASGSNNPKRNDLCAVFFDHQTVPSKKNASGINFSDLETALCLTVLEI